MGIKVFKYILLEIISVVVFDMLFYIIMLEYNYLYSVLCEYYEKFVVCKYGVYGISYCYVF